MNLIEYYKKKGITDKLLIQTILKENKDFLPHNNRAINGYNIKKDLTCTVSITKPKYWPEKGYIETLIN